MRILYLFYLIALIFLAIPAKADLIVPFVSNENWPASLAIIYTLLVNIIPFIITYVVELVVFRVAAKFMNWKTAGKILLINFISYFTLVLFLYHRLLMNFFIVEFFVIIVEFLLIKLFFKFSYNKSLGLSLLMNLFTILFSLFLYSSSL